MSKRSRLIPILLVAVLAMLAGGLSARYLSRPAAPEQALKLEAPRPVSAFTLRDHEDVSFDRSDLTGRWTLLFFGFTRCPDICPTTLHTLAGVHEALAELSDESRPAVVMVSVDPLRDTPDKLAAYVPFFHADFVGVTGDMTQIMNLTRDLGVAFSYTPVSDSNVYGVDHTASIFLIDPEARLAAIFSTPHVTERIVRDYVRIVSDVT